MKNLIGNIAGVFLIAALVYGVYYVGKTFSYKLFYEGMVIDSIQEMVKPSCINEQ